MQQGKAVKINELVKSQEYKKNWLLVCGFETDLLPNQLQNLAKAVNFTESINKTMYSIFVICLYLPRRYFGLIKNQFIYK